MLKYTPSTVVCLCVHVQDLYSIGHLPADPEPICTLVNGILCLVYHDGIQILHPGWNPMLSRKILPVARIQVCEMKGFSSLELFCWHWHVFFNCNLAGHLQFAIAVGIYLSWSEPVVSADVEMYTYSRSVVSPRKRQNCWSGWGYHQTLNPNKNCSQNPLTWFLGWQASRAPAPTEDAAPDSVTEGDTKKNDSNFEAVDIPPTPPGDLPAGLASALTTGNQWIAVDHTAGSKPRPRYQVRSIGLLLRLLLLSDQWTTSTFQVVI